MCFAHPLLSLAALGVLCTTSTSQVTIGDPTDVAGNVVWLDGQDPDGDGVPGGTLLGGGSRWTDKSTSGLADAVQNAPGRRPSLVPAGLNGMSVLRFDGNDYMDLESASFGMLNGVDGATLMAVVATDVTTPQRLFMVATTESQKTRAGINLFDGFGTSLGGSGEFGAAGRRLDSDGFQRIEGGDVVLGEFELFAAVFDYAAGELSLYVDGQLVTQVANFQSPGSTSATDSINIRIGADANLSMLHGIFDGDLAELVAYDRALPGADRAAVEEWMSAKWFGDPWTDLGHGLAGVTGTPALVGAGPLVSGTSVSLSLSNASPLASSWLVIGFSELNAPLKGGVLVPSPDVLFAGLPVNGGGSLSLASSWPPGIPSGSLTAWQFWIPDAAGPLGFAASNAVRAVTP